MWYILSNIAIMTKGKIKSQLKSDIAKTRKNLHEDKWKAIMQYLADGDTLKKIAHTTRYSIRTLEAFLASAKFEEEAVSTTHLMAIYFRKNLIK